jgi:multisubunit Na+/H+ antiporter MnhG subunit
MDFSKLSSNERTATFAAIVLVLGGIVSNWGGLMWLSVLAGIVVLVVIFLPQLSPQTSLPGSKGSLLVALGAVAAIGAVIEILRFLNYFTNTLDDWQTWAFAIALVASLVLLWAAWMQLQSEGGKFQFGSQGSAAAAPPPPPADASSTAAPPAAAPPAESPPPAAPPAAASPPAAPPPASPPPAAPPAEGSFETPPDDDSSGTPA